MNRKELIGQLVLLEKTSKLEAVVKSVIEQLSQAKKYCSNNYQIMHLQECIDVLSRNIPDADRVSKNLAYDLLDREEESISIENNLTTD